MAGEAKAPVVPAANDVALEKQVDEITDKAAADIATKAAREIGKRLISGDVDNTVKSPISFDASTGKWVVSSSLLAKPIKVSSKQKAVAVFKAISAANSPDIRFDAGKFLIDHSDWKSPVVAATAEEAVELVTDKFKEDGYSDVDANAVAKELVDSATVVPVAASAKIFAVEHTTEYLEHLQKAHALMVEEGCEDHAGKLQALIDDTKKPELDKGGQTAMASTVQAADQKAPAGPKDQAIAGPKTEGIKQGAPGSDSHPSVPGYVVTEKPAKDVLPSGGKDGGLKQEQKSSDYEGSAKKHDALVEQLKAKKGLMTSASQLADTTEGMKALGTALAIAKGALMLKADVTEEARSFISNKIAKIREDHPDWDQDRAIAAAYSVAREAGYQVPEPPK